MAKLPDFIHVDRNNLHKEWSRISSDYMRYALRVADCQESVQELEAELELVESELDDKIRRRPERFSLSDPKEAAIKFCIRRQDKYKEALKALNEEKARLRVYQAAVKSLELKSKALENLSWLDQRGYFTRVTLPKKAKFE